MKCHNFQPLLGAWHSFPNTRLGKNLAIKKINSDLEYNGYSLTNPHSGFVNQEALLQTTAQRHFSKDQVTSAQPHHGGNFKNLYLTVQKGSPVLKLPHSLFTLCSARSKMSRSLAQARLAIEQQQPQSISKALMTSWARLHHIHGPNQHLNLWNCTAEAAPGL